MRKYVDYKYTSWGRMYFKEDADISKIIDKLEQGYLPIELCDDPELGVQIYPITSKNKLGNCQIEIPLEDIDLFVQTLKDLK